MEDLLKKLLEFINIRDLKVLYLIISNFIDWGVVLDLKNITYVNFPVYKISYSKASNELILTGKAKLYLDDNCHGKVSRLKLSE